MSVAETLQFIDRHYVRSVNGKRFDNRFPLVRQSIESPLIPVFRT